MFCPSSIAFAERQKLSKSTWKAIDCVPILSRVPPRYSISIHSEAASTQKPAVIKAASQTVELPLLRTSVSPPRINRDHREHHTRLEVFQHFSTLRPSGSACQHGASRLVSISVCQQGCGKEDCRGRQVASLCRFDS